MMSIDELEAEVLRLGRQERARLAGRLLDSLEGLSVEENEQLWCEEAERRDAAWDSKGDAGRPAVDVFRDAMTRLS